MSEELLNEKNADPDMTISLDLIEQTIGIKKEVIKAELGITEDEIPLSVFKERVQALTQETFEN